MTSSRSHCYAIALLEAWESSSAKDQPAVLQRFVTELTDSNLTALGPEIITALERETADRTRRATAQITVARPATEASKGFEQFAPTNIVVDATLGGGFTVRRQNEIVDASVRGALDAIRRVLATA